MKRFPISYFKLLLVFSEKKGGSMLQKCDVVDSYYLKWAYGQKMEKMMGL